MWHINTAGSGITKLCSSEYSGQEKLVGEGSAARRKIEIIPDVSGKLLERGEYG